MEASSSSGLALDEPQNEIFKQQESDHNQGIPAHHIQLNIQVAGWVSSSGPT